VIFEATIKFLAFKIVSLIQYNVDRPSEDGLLRTETCKGLYKHINTT
jgi:hypothetical protein